MEKSKLEEWDARLLEIARLAQKAEVMYGTIAFELRDLRFDMREALKP